MELLENISKNEDIQNYMVENENLIQIMDDESDKFSERLKGFILANSEEFLAESVDEIKKNILTFSETATAQYMKEVSAIVSIYATPLVETAVVTNEKDEGSNINDYL
ncbi:MAG: hypothetical protein J7L15_01955 [Clostridiales bacterium]|nr:hypothetical protein [Clostridiales bacterium]